MAARIAFGRLGVGEIAAFIQRRSARGHEENRQVETFSVKCNGSATVHQLVDTGERRPIVVEYYAFDGEFPSTILNLVSDQQAGDQRSMRRPRRECPIECWWRQRFDVDDAQPSWRPVISLIKMHWILLVRTGRSVSELADFFQLIPGLTEFPLQWLS